MARDSRRHTLAIRLRHTDVTGSIQGPRFFRSRGDAPARMLEWLPLLPCRVCMWLPACLRGGLVCERVMGVRFPCTLRIIPLEGLKTEL